ncbi:hypothetical protein BCR44DRAFT_1425851 [Catenaria anguillulae PL171]|uniref:Uncharacterized protein n=1 Tax=Catenaria anguillulae PL171 TaxID=765915 RepID=A0A1Y2HZ99_9FUNG|nr:hypothetical protein BCR44DRAFT_1425851 [Catenaria anguillulae PL171]
MDLPNRTAYVSQWVLAIQLATAPSCVAKGGNWPGGQGTIGVGQRWSGRWAAADWHGQPKLHVRLNPGLPFAANGLLQIVVSRLRFTSARSNSRSASAVHQLAAAGTAQ